MDYDYKNIWDKVSQSKHLSESDTSVVYYSLSKLGQQLEFLKQAFGNEQNVLHTTAIKTNPHPAVLKYIAGLGHGLEAASFEEVSMAIRAGVAPNKIIYNSPVKTKREIDSCINNYPGIFINANSFDELQRIPEDADVQIGLRINPCIEPGTNFMFNVSTRHSKFGIPIAHEQQILDAVLKHHITAFHLHVGSQVTNLQEAVKGISLVYELAEKANRILGKKDVNREPVSYINIGGGISSGDTETENRDNMKLYAAAIKKEIPQLMDKYDVITEFGQWTHRLNAICFSRVEYVKPIKDDYAIAYIHLGGDMFPREIYTDMNDFSYSVIRQSGTPDDDNVITYDIAGPLCYNGDYVAKGLKLPSMREGDIFVIENVGANTFGLWSRHCSRSVPKFITYDEKRDGMKMLSRRFKPFENFI